MKCTVGELIEALQSHDSDLVVKVGGVDFDPSYIQVGPNRSLKLIPDIVCEHECTCCGHVEDKVALNKTEDICQD